MIATFVRKEFLENLLNQRFAISLLLVALISWTSTFVLTRNYNDELRDYHRRVNLQNRMVDEYFHLRGWDGSLMMPPKPPPILSPLVQGVQRDWLFGRSIDENPVVVLFPFMDVLFVVGVLMSIASLTLSYDRISGEKESGTLRLMLAGHCKRGTLLMGKWAGGLLSVQLILVVSLLGSVLIAYGLSESPWSSAEWVALLALGVLSGLYCTVSYSLGLMISARTHASSDSILLSLVFFAVFTLILPTAPPYVAQALRPVPSPAKTQYEAFVVLKQEEDNALGRLRERYKALPEDSVERAMKPEQEKINAEFENRADVLKSSALRSSAMRELMTAFVHSLSPFSCYVLAGAELTGTGAMAQIDFLQNAERYVGMLYREYLPLKEREARKANPGFTNMTRLDISDRPRFEYRGEPTTYRLAGAAGHTVFLLIYASLFLLLAWKAILRYDVR